MEMSPPLLDCVSDLVNDIRAEVHRQDTDHPLFHGCWDWHSAVHGHWALLAGATLLGTTDDVDWVAARLKSRGMDQEFDTLAADPTFERPYGRAWLLRLVLTFEQLTGDHSLRQRTQEGADALQQWLSTSLLSPDIGEYQNPAWALLQLYAWATHIEDQPTRQWVEHVVHARFLGRNTTLTQDVSAPGEFFSRWSVQATLIHTVLGPETLRMWLQQQRIERGHLQLVNTLHSAHHLAIHASRSWGLSCIASATAQPHWAQAHQAHIQASVDLHPHWRHDRRAYTHWVPQFTIYALCMAQDPSRSLTPA